MVDAAHHSALLHYFLKKDNNNNLPLKSFIYRYVEVLLRTIRCLLLVIILQISISFKHVGKELMNLVFPFTFM